MKEMGQMQDVRQAQGWREPALAQRAVTAPKPGRRLSDWYAWASPYAWAAGLEPETCPCRIVRRERALYVRGRLAHRNPLTESLLAAAEWYVFSEWADRLAARHLVCHAAALERHGGALLLLGKTGAGKSRAAPRSELLAAGPRTRRQVSHISTHQSEQKRRTWDQNG